MLSNKTLLTEPGCGRAILTDGTLGKDTFLPASVSTIPPHTHTFFDLFEIGFLYMALVVPELTTSVL